MEKLETGLYSRLNHRIGEYKKAVNIKADPEIIHSELRNLIDEAIKMNISLSQLQDVFNKHIHMHDTKDFQDNITKQYARGKERRDERVKTKINNEYNTRK